ncbi:MAG: hypothetical protein ACUVR3_10855 [Candidatus Roseilinea sp.]|uniref:hypothetical protein n=1 Tax=Candidatus Roseilinea sp. TaxID=2838777 RepID=UPI00404A1100
MMAQSPVARPLPGDCARRLKSRAKQTKPAQAGLVPVVRGFIRRETQSAHRQIGFGFTISHRLRAKRNGNRIPQASMTS